MPEACGKEVEEIYWRALQIAAPAERTAFLNHACQGRAILRENVDQMLAMQSEVEEFFLEAESARRKLLGPH